MKIVNRATKDLIPYENNAKVHDQTQIANVANSIKRFGWQQPIVIDDNDVVVIGHCRLLAAKRLGLEEVPVTVASGLTDDEIRELRIADNKTNESPWDFDMLEHDRDGLAFDGFQFSWVEDEEGEYEAPPQPDAVEDNFDPEEDVPEESDIRRGDVFIMGRHRLMCGDSCNIDDVMTLMGGAKADMFLTDPPYNINYEEKQKNLSVFRENKRVTGGNVQIENDYTDDASYISFLEDAFQCADRVMREGAAFYIWHAAIHVEKVIEAIKNTGWQHKQHLIWVKSVFSLTRMDYQYRHEPCWYGWKNGKHYFTERRNESTVIDDRINPKKLRKEEMLELLERLLEDRVPTTVLYEDKPLFNDIHPTMKPIKLMARLIANSSQPGWSVLDLFGGSGSTMMACEQLDRVCYTMELDPKYCAAILNRFTRFTGEPVYRLVNGEKIPYVTDQI